MSIHNVESITSQMALTDKSRAEADPPLMAEMEERPVVGKNVPVEDRGGLAKYNIVLVNVFCQVQ